MLIQLLMSIALILLGLLACSSLIISRRPDAKALLDKIVPFQGIIGVVVLVLGLVGLIQAVLHLGAVFSSLAGIVGLVAVFVSLALGFLASYSLLGQWFGGSAAAAKGVELRAKLIVYQVPLGIAGIVFGVWGVILWLRYGL